MRLTRKSEKMYLGYDATEELIKQHNASPIIAKLGQLEDKEEKLGIDLNEFLEELNFVLLNSNETVGYTRKGKRIVADYGCVMDFLKSLKEAMEEELE